MQAMTDFSPEPFCFEIFEKPDIIKSDITSTTDCVLLVIMSFPAGFRSTIISANISTSTSTFENTMLLNMESSKVAVNTVGIRIN